MTSLIQAALFAAATLPGLAAAAVHYVRPGATGANTGVDWTNAYLSLPTRLGRGDTYFLADGNYGAHTFAEAASGSATITIVKATAASHGTNSGWNASYGDGQAVFSNWQIYTDNYVFDGQRRNADWATGGLSQYGLRVAGTRPVRLDDGNGKGANNLRLRYVDFEGGGRDTGSGDDVIYGLTGNSNLTFQYCALHDSDRTLFLMRGNWKNLTVDHSYLARNTSTPATHGEALSMTESDGVTWSNNVMEDIEGTAFIAGLNNGTVANWRVFGNVAFHSAAYLADTGRKNGHNWGVAAFIYIGHDAENDNYGNNIQVYNNTIANIQGVWSGVVILAGSGNAVRNNLWYASVQTNNSFSGSIGNNWYYNTQADNDNSTTRTVCTVNCNVFVNAAAKNFRLAAPTGGGMSLPVPFSVDSDGVTRAADGTWDRGAYEFSAGTPATVARPRAPHVN